MKPRADKRPTATVVIRVRNEVSWIEGCLQMTLRQQDVDFEIVCVDSGSTDGSLDVIRRYPVRLIEIPAEDFTFSHALNVGAAAGSGDFLVCLNADAEPADERWMIELLHPLWDDARVAASYSRQVPREKAHPTVLRDYAWAFGPVAPQGDPPFFSMSSSGYRRFLWERHPFWSNGGAGDDIEWVRWALTQGWRVQYAPRSVVLHSHNYTAVEHFHKARRERRVMVELYGRRKRWSPSAIGATFLLDCLRDAQFLSARRTWRLFPGAIVCRLGQAAGRVHGYLLARPTRDDPQRSP